MTFDRSTLQFNGIPQVEHVKKDGVIYIPEFPFLVESDLQWWLNLAPDLKWHYASSMPTTPHSYCHRFRQLKDPHFSRAFGVIRTWGEPGRFNGRPNIYLRHVDDEEVEHRWWFMSKHDSENGILNYSIDGKVYGPQDVPNTYSETFTPYDQIGAWYTDVYDTVTRQDGIAMWKLLEREFPGRRLRALELGAGAGRSFDARILGPSMTTAVDPSRAMLNSLFEQHPRVKSTLCMTAEEYLAAEIAPRSNDLVLASFGAGSYLSPEAIEALPDQLLPGGKIVLSFYDEDYLPGYYAQQWWTGNAAELNEGYDLAVKMARGQVEKQGNFQVVTIAGAR